MDAIHRAASATKLGLPDLTPWSQLAPASARSLLAASTSIVLGRGDQVDADLGVVLSGVFAIEHDLSDGRRVLSELFRKGDLADLRRSDRAPQGRLIALRTSTFLMLDENWIDRAAHDHPDITSAMAAQLRERLSSLRDHATDLAAKTPFEKLASVLFEFQRWPEAGIDEHERRTVRIPIHRVDIADYIGVKPETLSRAIRILERERLISLPNPDRILITDLPAMRQIANGGRPRRSTKRA